MLPHQRGQERVESLAQPVLLHGRLLAQRAERAVLALRWERLRRQETGDQKDDDDEGSHTCHTGYRDRLLPVTIGKPLNS